MLYIIVVLNPPALCAGFFSIFPASPCLAGTILLVKVSHLIRGFLTSIQLTDRAHASRGKVVQGHCCCREIK